MEENSNIFQEKTTADDINESDLSEQNEINSDVSEVNSDTEINSDVSEVNSDTETNPNVSEINSDTETNSKCQEEETEQPAEENNVSRENNSDTENNVSDDSAEQAVEEKKSEETPQTNPQSDENVSESEKSVEIDEIKKSIELLKDGLNQALMTLNKKNVDIKFLEDKLDTYKRTVEDKLVSMFFIDIISIIDNIKRMSSLYREKPENPGYVPCDTFEFYAADLESILLNNSVEIIPTVVGSKFNPRNQRIIKKIPTDDKNLHGIIEKVFSEGYVFGGRVISPAKVSAYFYTEPKG